MVHDQYLPNIIYPTLFMTSLPNIIPGQYLSSILYDQSIPHYSFKASSKLTLFITSLPSIIHGWYLPNIIHDQSTQHYS